MPVYERLSMVVSFTLIGLALYFIIDLPTRVLDFEIFGLAVEMSVSQRLLMTILLGSLAFTGSGTVMRASDDDRISYGVPFWVNPTLIVILATLTLARLGTPLRWALGLMTTGLLLWFTLLAEYTINTPERKFASLAKLWSQWMSYLLMLAYAILIYQSQISLIFNAVCLLLLGWLLGASIYKQHAESRQAVGRFGFLTGLGLSQIMWVLQTWRINWLSAGLLTLLIFYLLSGIVVAYLQDRFSRRVAIEYGAVAMIGVWIVIQFV